MLGLREEPRRDAANITLAAGSGSHLELMVKPEAVSREATAITFEVDDVDREVQELESRGAMFEDVDIPGARVEGRVCVLGNERAAWFKDSEGNWLCVHNRVTTPA